tara:strand:- start:480 stop:902 length:423 start_codon:yes stop_codon:yes gene_type:complete
LIRVGGFFIYVGQKYCDIEKSKHTPDRIMTPFRLLTATGTLGLIIWVLITPQIPLAALLLLIPLIPLQIALSQYASQCTECGISVSNPAFNNPERELPFKFDYGNMGNDWASRNYRRKLGALPLCAACRQRIRESSERYS